MSIFTGTFSAWVVSLSLEAQVECVLIAESQEKNIGWQN